jgi:hypothetical protein
MNRNMVIARAFGGRPLRRIIMGSQSGLAYLAAPEAVLRIESGDLFAVGFPKRDVFRFDETAFQQLELEWRAIKRTNNSSWAKLELYGLN